MIQKSKSGQSYNRNDRATYFIPGASPISVSINDGPQTTVAPESSVRPDSGDD